ncbi:MAG: NAD(P)H-dependent glycerol-3-phosphate dehydrogenase [Eubacteriales bacterium]
MKITVVGSGSWGTALSLVLVKNGNDVTLWGFDEKQIENMRKTRENPLLSGVNLPETLALTTDLMSCQDSGVVVLAVPSFAVRETAKKLKDILKEGTVIVSVSKGIEKDSFLRLSQVIEEEVPQCPVVVLSGPSHAEEVGAGKATGLVVAAEEQVHGEMIQDLFMNSKFRVYTSYDKIGTELGAAFKNIMAICVGFSEGVAPSDNTKAMLMTRGLAEMARLGVSLGAKRDTFNGLAGVGDLIVTCTSDHSRNRRFGILIGQGKTLEEAQKLAGGVVEGYYATATAYALGKSAGVELPIVGAAYQVMFEGKQPLAVMEGLMLRAKRSEEDPVW